MFTFPDPDPLTAPIIEVIDVSFTYPNGTKIFEEINFGITMESRIAIVGPNGAGKSTLLNLITQDLSPTSGDIRSNRRMRLGRYAQHFLDLLPYDLSPVEYLQQTFVELSYQECMSSVFFYIYLFKYNARVDIYLFD